jgi:simple sugar transport system permease protein
VGEERVSEEQPTGQRGGVARTIKRALTSLASALLFPLIAIFMAFVIGAVIVLATGSNPLSAYAALFMGAFGSASSIGETLLEATPLIFTGLAVAVAFRAGLFNIGGEGQFFIGAITAAGLGVALGSLGILSIPLVLAACVLTGFIWGAIPGFLKARFGAHEVIVTIMLNYIAINLAVYLADNPLSAGDGSVPGTAFIPPEAQIPMLGFGLGRADYSFLLALIAAAVAYILLWRTRLGFQIRAVGHSPGAAGYAGMRLGTNTVLALAIGGAFASLGGAVLVLGVFGKMTIPFVTNVGFTGIGVALVGRSHPVGVVLAAILFGALSAGANQMQFDTDVPLDLADVLLAVILLLVTADKLVEWIVGKRARDFGSGNRLDRGMGS